MRRKYLDDIGCLDRWDKWEYEGEAAERYRKQRAEYGFDERETFSLQDTFYQWLYERLKMYREVGGMVVDLTFHKFEWKGEERSQLEIIDLLIKELEWALVGEANIYDDGDCKRLIEIGEMWAIILPAMWW